MKCDTCKHRFVCFTLNTSDQPRKLCGINIRITECCYRCKHSRFDPEVQYYFHSWTNPVGKCVKHLLMVHQFSTCDTFASKATNNSMDIRINQQITKETNELRRNKRPKWCILDEQ
jgi:hypothetical protein